MGAPICTPLNVIEWSEIQKKKLYTADERDKILATIRGNTIC